MDTMDLFVSKWRERVKASPWMNDGDKKLFSRFATDAGRHQIGDSRISKYLTDANITHLITGRGLMQTTARISGLKRTCGEINNSKKYGVLIKRDVKGFLASLYNFRHTGERSLIDANAKIKACARHKIKAADKRIAKPTISRDEIRELEAHSKDIMDKAMLWLLFESGMRNGEFQKLTIGDVSQTDEGIDVKVPAGKTGERVIVAVEAAKFVNNWLEAHPSKKPSSPLWVNEHGESIMRAAISRRLRLMKDRLNEYRQKEGIPLFKKSMNPHNFRHSRASELGGEPGMTEAILCKYLGWEIGSPMPKTYLHLTPEQVRKAVLRTYGKAKPEEQKKIITSWICPRCKDETSIGKSYCGRCGSPKDGKVISKTAMLEAELAALRKEQAETKREMAELALSLTKKKLREKIFEKIKK